MKFTITEFDSLPSTNSYLKERAADFPIGQVICAKEQSSGRGRLGRQFTSPESGLYFSVLLRPKSIEETLFLPIIAGIAVARGIQTDTGVLPLLKWPNDVLLDGKKICGMLAEGVADGRVVLGIGINIGASRTYFDKLNLPHVSSILAQTGKKPERLNLLDAVLSELDSLLDKPHEEVLTIYRGLCLTLGQEITASNGICGVAKDISQKGELIVETTEKKMVVLNSGEVSISGMY